MDAGRANIRARPVHAQIRLAHRYGRGSRYLEQFPSATFTLVPAEQSEDDDEYRLGAFDIGEGKITLK
jgi:hypothetical protein